MILIILLTICRNTLGKGLYNTLFRQDLEKIQNIGLHLAAEYFVHNAAALFHRHIGGGKKPQKFRLGSETFLQNHQFLQNFISEIFVFGKAI